ncbi:50s ribosomal protein l24 [Diplodia corticola]|uniref:Large ribosomal subunit protein bL28m n=1 Tax=Diplodia corticola TaxID=236234 RepID=A0A1J9RWE0_9PEZI|nr:50s ribosomal protein l24 [Diplodia corticola]OJD31797.1 50s ribosomal protein l24 [Diplodia corticola]
MALRAPSSSSLALLARLTKPTTTQTQARTFASSAALGHKSTKSKLRDDHEGVPRYPYGPSLWYKQSNRGLYGGARIQFGNNVSHKTEIKTRRKWRPNIQRKSLFSRALNRTVRVRLSTRVLRTIDKVGGLDEYLLGEKSARIKELGMGGWLLRWRLMQTDAVKKRYAEQRAALLLEPEETRGMAGEKVTDEQLATQIRAYDAMLDKQGSTVPLSEADQDAVIQEADQEAVDQTAEKAVGTKKAAPKVVA